jgi:hypothetical protein
MQEHREKSREIKGHCARLFELGYPVLPIAPGHKYPALFENGGWRTHGIGELQRLHPANDLNCAQWDAWGASAGIHFNGTGFCGLDIDSLDPETSRHIRAIAVDILGRTMERFGRKPKALFVYACNPALRYRRWTLDADNKVELLAGDNKMAVMLGKHPDTGQPYEVQLWASDWLTPISNRQLDAFFEALTAAFPGSYVSTPGEDHGPDPERAKAISEAMRRLNDAVLAMPVGELAERFRQSCAGDEELHALWKRGDKQHDDSQSGLVFAMARALRQRGYSLEEYARIVMSWPRITHQQSCRNARALARAWVNSTPKASAFNEADWFEAIPPEPVTGFWRFYRRPVAAAHPARDFIYGSTYQRMLVGATYAGTKVGKTSLLVTEALAMASGKTLLGRSPHGAQRVALWNGEDALIELERLVMGALQHHGLDYDADISDRLILESGHDEPLRLVNEFGALVPDAFKRIEANIRFHRADVVILDPLISLTGGQESNAAFDAIGKELGRIAAATGAAIHIAHHIRKPGFLKAATSLEDGRGGGSLTAAVRSARALSTMTASEAGKCGIDPRQASRYFRVTDAATNTALSPMADDYWYFKQSVTLDNGDDVGVVTLANIRYGAQPGDDQIEPWRPPVLKELEPPARWRSDPRAPEWAGRLIAKHANLDPDDSDDRKQIRVVLGRWIRLGLIEELAQRDEHSRKPRNYLVATRLAQPED